MPRVVHFELLADNPEQAAKFYSNVFGWNIQKWEGGEQPYWLVTTGEEGEPGINGGLMRPGGELKATVVTIGVPSIDEYISRVEQGGGKVVMAKQEIPGMGWSAYFTDPAGTVVGLYQDMQQGQTQQ